MPTYDYQCKACGHAFEKFQSITGPVVRKCPVCGKSKVKRLIGTGAGIIFKGSGFYATDYRSDSYRKAAEKEKPATAGGTSEPKPSAAGESPKAPSSPKKDKKT
jgi:putative FmdB family regulatory protein